MAKLRNYHHTTSATITSVVCAYWWIISHLAPRIVKSALTTSHHIYVAVSTGWIVLSALAVPVVTATIATVIHIRTMSQLLEGRKVKGIIGSNTGPISLLLALPNSFKGKGKLWYCIVLLSSFGGGILLLYASLTGQNGHNMYQRSFQYSYETDADTAHLGPIWNDTELAALNTYNMQRESDTARPFKIQEQNWITYSIPPETIDPIPITSLPGKLKSTVTNAAINTVSITCGSAAPARYLGGPDNNCTQYMLTRLITDKKSLSEQTVGDWPYKVNFTNGNYFGTPFIQVWLNSTSCIAYETVCQITVIGYKNTKAMYTNRELATNYKGNANTYQAHGAEKLLITMFEAYTDNQYLSQYKYPMSSKLYPQLDNRTSDALKISRAKNTVEIIRNLHDGLTTIGTTYEGWPQQGTYHEKWVYDHPGGLTATAGAVGSAILFIVNLYELILITNNHVIRFLSDRISSVAGIMVIGDVIQTNKECVTPLSKISIKAGAENNHLCIKETDKILAPIQQDTDYY
jgi:hypothetical protein